MKKGEVGLKAIVLGFALFSLGMVSLDIIYTGLAADSGTTVENLSAFSISDELVKDVNATQLKIKSGTITLGDAGAFIAGGLEAVRLYLVSTPGTLIGWVNKVGPILHVDARLLKIVNGLIIMTFVFIVLAFIVRRGQT